MSETLSRREDGREAFMPGANPEDYCNYKKDSYNFKSRFDDFMAGWIEASDQYDLQQKEVKKDNDDFNAIKYGCPWSTIHDTCVATKANCYKENCAFWYFKHNS